MRLALALFALAALLTAVAAGAATRPSLRLLDDSPVVVRGTGFAPGERVAVTASTRARSVTRRAAATRLGVFTVRFDLSLPCTGAVVKAVGARSGTVRVLPSPRHCIELDP